jgi:hypothetical protein
MLTALRRGSFLIALGCVAYWGINQYDAAMNKPETEVSPPSVESPSAEKHQPQSRFRTIVRQAVPAPVAVPSVDSGIPQKPDGNVIQFQVVDGLAIAYGDLVLGKPEPGFSRTSGFYEAPTPQQWSSPEIPYVISKDLPNPARVEKALEYLREHTVVRFIPFTGERDAVVFEPGTTNCYSSLGRIGGLQSIKLAAGCQWPEILHEIMHALGFVHEQSRPDRDRYVEVLWPNIDDEFRPQFNVVPETFTYAVRGSDFDYHSIMLYRPTTFAKKEGLPVMRSKSTELIAPVDQGLSETDIKRINRLFGRG